LGLMDFASLNLRLASIKKEVSVLHLHLMRFVYNNKTFNRESIVCLLVSKYVNLKPEPYNRQGDPVGDGAGATRGTSLIRNTHPHRCSISI